MKSMSSASVYCSICGNVLRATPVNVLVMFESMAMTAVPSKKIHVCFTAGPLVSTSNKSRSCIIYDFGRNESSLPCVVDVDMVDEIVQVVEKVVVEKVVVEMSVVEMFFVEMFVVEMFFVYILFSS